MSFALNFHSLIKHFLKSSTESTCYAWSIYLLYVGYCYFSFRLYKVKWNRLSSQAWTWWWFSLVEAPNVWTIFFLWCWLVCLFYFLFGKLWTASQSSYKGQFWDVLLEDMPEVAMETKVSLLTVRWKHCFLKSIIRRIW